MDSILLLKVISVGYFLGSIPYGLVLVKVFYGIDIRQIGSKNIGATNVLRAGYKGIALITLFLDSFKGAIAILISSYYLHASTSYVGICALATIIGHIFPVWLKFKGGKGVATFLGTILALNINLFIISAFTWIITAFVTKYSSLSAIMAVSIFPISCYFIEKELFIVSIVITLLIIYKHKENIIRLNKKTETKINLKK